MREPPQAAKAADNGNKQGPRIARPRGQGLGYASLTDRGPNVGENLIEYQCGRHSSRRILPFVLGRQHNASGILPCGQQTDKTVSVRNCPWSENAEVQDEENGGPLDDAQKNLSPRSRRLFWEPWGACPWSSSVISTAVGWHGMRAPVAEQWASGITSGSDELADMAFIVGDWSPGLGTHARERTEGDGIAGLRRL